MVDNQLRIKRVYDSPSRDDGHRVLVDRLWPRGLSKSDARIDLWVKSLAPSKELRRWYGHDPSKWHEFKRRYFSELGEQKEVIEELVEYIREGQTTLVYGSKERRLNNAFALQEYLQTHL